MNEQTSERAGKQAIKERKEGKKKTINNKYKCINITVNKIVNFSKVSLAYAKQLFLCMCVYRAMYGIKKTAASLSVSIPFLELT